VHNCWVGGENTRQDRRLAALEGIRSGKDDVEARSAEFWESFLSTGSRLEIMDRGGVNK
jgi:hypothetical protein